MLKKMITTTYKKHYRATMKQILRDGVKHSYLIKPLALLHTGLDVLFFVPEVIIGVPIGCMIGIIGGIVSIFKEGFGKSTIKPTREESVVVTFTSSNES